ncbi:hypothetical protein J6590_027893 [Homalodisca vitripennis]|nr:hypothetical protein J6590_027893 [Homalodisca vitripennis]
MTFPCILKYFSVYLGANSSAAHLERRSCPDLHKVNEVQSTLNQTENPANVASGSEHGPAEPKLAKLRFDNLLLAAGRVLSPPLPVDSSDTSSFPLIGDGMGRFSSGSQQ